MPKVAWNMENMMNEISFPAMQFVPRFVSVLILVALTWLVAGFARYMIKRTIGSCSENDGETSGLSRIISKVAFWSVFILMAPFIFNAAGIDGSWLSVAQRFEGQVFANWPLWTILGLVVVGIWFVIQGVPKLFVQMKSQGEVQS
jgi:hypothetical protein